MEDLDVNATIWRMFMNTTLQSAGHLGQDQNLRFVDNHFWSSVKKLFKETEKLINDQKKITGVSMIDYNDYTWSATSLLCDSIHQISNAKTYVFAVLCLGGIKENPNEAWKEKIKWYFEKNHLKDLNRIDGESMEFEWKIFQGPQHLASSNIFKNSWKNNHVIESSSKARSSSCQCSTTLHGEKKKMKRNVKVMLTKLRILLADFRAVIGHSWDLAQERNDTELILISLMELATELLRKWWLNSQKPPIRFSVLQAHLKEKNYDAKEEVRRLSISMVVNKTSNW